MVTQKKFESGLKKEDHSKETKVISGGLVNSFKAAVRKIFSSTPVTQVPGFDSIISTTAKAGRAHADKAAQPKPQKRSFTDRVKTALSTGKHTDKLVKSSQQAKENDQGRGSHR